jgi:hypothetical protein
MSELLHHLVIERDKLCFIFPGCLHYQGVHAPNALLNGNIGGVFGRPLIQNDKGNILDLEQLLLYLGRQLLGAGSAANRRDNFYGHGIRHDGNIPTRDDGIPNLHGLAVSRFIFKQGCDDN